MRHIALPLPSIPELPDDEDIPANEREPSAIRSSEMMDEEQ